MNQSISDTLVQLDEETNSKLRIVQTLIQNNERFFEKQTNDGLRTLAKAWNVSHLYTIKSSDGKYLTSSCEPPEELPSIYYYCKDYRNLANGKKNFELTPLVHGEPEQEAYKFFHFPSKDRSRIYEIALHARFLGRVLKKTIESYTSILSIGLFSPNGDSLGLFSKNQEIGRTERIVLQPKKYPYFEDTEGSVFYYTRVPSQVSDCCQCKKHMNGSGGQDDFSYILRTEVSKKELQAQLQETIWIVSTLTAIAFVLSIICARLLSNILTRNLTRISERIFTIIRSGELQEIEVTGKDEISQLGINFNHMILKLRQVQSQLIHLEINTAIAKTTQMLAHDVRRPFSMLKSLLSIFASSEDPATISKLAKKHLVEIDNAILSVNGMIEDVMEIGRTTGPHPLPADPATLLEDALLEVCRIYPKKGIQLVYEYDHKSEVSVDRLKCQRVFVNIITNAFQAIQGKGTITFKTDDQISQGAGFVKFSIKNTGSFIEESDLREIFNAFYTKNRKHGTGLGLAIAEKVVTAHGGKVWCESSRETMTVEICLTLPAVSSRSTVITHATPPGSTDAILVTLEPTLVSEHPQVKTHTRFEPKESEIENLLAKKLIQLRRLFSLTIVEDEALYSNSLLEMIGSFSQLAGLLDTRVLSNVDDALAHFETSNADLLICDVDLGNHGNRSEMNGIELVSVLRKQGFRGAVCIHSNRSLPDDAQIFASMGEYAFLPKPMSRLDLLNLLMRSVRD